MSENNINDVFDNNPELAAVSSVMDLEFAIRNQSEDDQIKTMLIIAAAMTDNIIGTGKYTFDGIMNEIRKNQGIVKRIIDRMKEEDDEEDD